MAIFLLRYVALFGSLNLYLCWTVGQAWPDAAEARIALAVFCSGMVGVAVFVRLFERGRLFRVTRVLAVVTHAWLTLLLWLCMLVMPVDAWNLGARWLAGRTPEARDWLAPMRPVVMIAGALMATASLWALWEAAHVRLRTVTLACLPPGSAPVRVVQLSDVHLGISMSAARFARILDLVRRAQPDVLVATGDMLDGSFDHSRRPQDLLAQIQPPLGKFAVMGNHEYYRSTRESVTFLREAGFHILREELARVGDHLLIAGVDDPIGRRLRRRCMSREEAVLPAQKTMTTLLLKHRPIIRPASLGRFDLQLSGHTHGGQVFPLHLGLRLRHPYGPGLHNLDEGSNLYVSRGAGVWGPPMRLFAPPEVTLVVLTARG